MRAAASELPPRSNSESATLTRSRSSTFATISASIFSVSVPGATYSESTTISGSGSARRSNLPFTVSGRPSSSITTSGTM
ncbi:Uncharacterised protein [Mycobacteroides abscessus subsp. abscessus]|nr:Uncharacterised protein [Mycobacteroides abscessus subsp. abscessus]